MANNFRKTITDVIDVKSFNQLSCEEYDGYDLCLKLKLRIFNINKEYSFIYIGRSRLFYWLGKIENKFIVNDYFEESRLSTPDEDVETLLKLKYIFNDNEISEIVDKLVDIIIRSSIQCQLIKESNEITKKLEGK